MFMKNSMEFHGKFLGIHGIRWNSMEFFMKFSIEFSMEFHETEVDGLKLKLSQFLPLAGSIYAGTNYHPLQLVLAACTTVIE
jgi:hypothetical protein